MWVDITDLINDAGVGMNVDIFLLSDSSEMNDYGVILENESYDREPDIKDVFCTMVENVDDVVDFNKGSYVSRVNYDFYIPAYICLNNILEGATIRTKDNREFIVVREPIKRQYVSHCVVNATENNLRYEGGK